MAPRPRNDEKKARDKILEAASRLFAGQGYHATGVNQIIAEAGVSKATLFAHFPTKEDLGVAYLRAQDLADFAGVTSVVERVSDPRECLLALLDMMAGYMKQSGYRGCAFANMAAEFPDPENPMRKEVRRHDDNFRDLIIGVARRLKASDPRRYDGFNPEQFADTYYVLVEGALAASRHHHDIWPILTARDTVARLIGDHAKSQTRRGRNSAASTRKKQTRSN